MVIRLVLLELHRLVLIQNLGAALCWEAWDELLTQTSWFWPLGVFLDYLIHGLASEVMYPGFNSQGWVQRGTLVRFYVIKEKSKKNFIMFLVKIFLGS